MTPCQLTPTKQPVKDKDKDKEKRIARCGKCANCKAQVGLPTQCRQTLECLSGDFAASLRAALPGQRAARGLPSAREAPRVASLHTPWPAAPRRAAQAHLPGLRLRCAVIIRHRTVATATIALTSRSLAARVRRGHHRCALPTHWAPARATRARMSLRGSRAAARGIPPDARLVAPLHPPLKKKSGDGVAACAQGSRSRRASRASAS